MNGLILELIQGILIGAGAILPGISGASLAVVFGYYEEFTALIAHPRSRIKQFFHRHLSLVVGIAAGFIIFTLLLDKLFKTHTIPIVFLFSGFIAGTLPSIYRQAKKHGIGAGEIVSFCLTSGVMIAFTFMQKSGGGLLASATLQTHATGAASAVASSAATAPAMLAVPGIWILSGAVIGAGSLLPGVSASFILMYFGLYGPLLDAAGNLSIPILLQLGAGAAGAIILLSRLVNLLYRHCHGIMSFAVLGFTLGSLILVFPGLPDGKNLIPYAALALAGLAVSLFFGRENGE